ncbi:MAG TPA: glycosyltransferase family 39 protein [Gaiellaceae bacterium]|nr:glycosyltransferase family 39 protein [Gaiellaceae bacterium]
MGKAGSINIFLSSEAGALPAAEVAERGRLGVRSRATVLTAAVVVSTSVGAVLRFWGLGAQSFWFDETVTWNLVHRSLGSMLVHGIPSSESTPPLYYVLAWVWVRVVGSGEAGLRSLSALVGTATIPVAYLAARSFAGRRAGLLAALFVAVSPILVWYSQEARSYALLGFLCALSLLFFARLVSRYRTGDLAAWSAVAVLALTTHYFALFLLIVEAAWLWRRLPRRPVLAALTPPAVVCLLLAPLVYVQRGNAGGLAAASSLGARLGQTGEWFATGDLHSTTVWALSGVVAAVALVLLAADRRGRRRGLLPLAIGAATILLPVALAVAGKDYVFFRNLIPAWLPLTVAVAAGLSNPRFRALCAVGAVLLVAAFTYADLAVWLHPSLQRDNYRLLAAKVTASPQSAFVVYPGWDTTALEHYDPKLTPVRDGAIRIRDLTFVGVASNFGAWLPPRQVALAVPGTFHLLGTYRVQHFIVRRYAASSPVRISIQRLARIVHARPGSREPRLDVLAPGARGPARSKN